MIAAQPPSLLFALLLALISTLSPFLCYTKGLEGLEAGTASIIACIEPMIATISGVIIFHEQLTLTDILGILLVFTAVILINLPQKEINLYLYQNKLKEETAKN